MSDLRYFKLRILLLMSTAPATNDYRLFLQICSEVTLCNLPGQILNRTRVNSRVLVLVSLVVSEPEQVSKSFACTAFSAPINRRTGFGSTGAFGQPQQPQTNPMFGNLANPSTGTSAFGVSNRVYIVFLVTESYSTQAHLARIPHNQLRALQHSGLQSLPRAYLEGEATQLSEVAVILLAQQLGRGPRFSDPILTLGVRLVLLDRIEPPLVLVLPLQVSALFFL
jgi:hypothetical protein